MADALSFEEELAALPLFAGLPADQVEAMADSMLERSVKAGKTVMKQGQWGHELLIVLDGTLEVRRDGVVIAELGPGSCVGEMAVLEDHRRNATVVTATAARLGSVEYGQVHSLLAQFPELAARITATAQARRPDDA